MKTYFRWCLIFSLLLTFVTIPTINSYAEDIDSFSNLEAQLGIHAGSNYANTSISNIQVGELIEVTVVDPSKMGAGLKGDLAELIYIGNGEWKILKLAEDGNIIGAKLMVQNRDGIMKVTKNRWHNEGY
jgi:hypothetical protein